MDPSDRPQVPVLSPNPGQLSKARPETKRLGSYSATGGTPGSLFPSPNPPNFHVQKAPSPSLAHIRRIPLLFFLTLSCPPKRNSFPGSD
ncbi:uncharacterized protein LY79DRAFT_540417 [Colletotrichum navitas]|uniref:Uncharacterized protein n=1 Tax=Colletotrichum navitas TaxID=681940 RepID=A0AAD8Q8L4_9PEZI|nr:uncharacterized protein LY79DRAFT_540417 [Colletotrichum navitas]KAK1597594.1 hypothetical protein LY79DRAFT_540417 [Colletotrichum navitas]